MSSTTHRSEDAALETVELGAVYQICAPRTGEPWTLYKVADDCGVDSIEPLDIPDGWNDVYEFAVAGEDIWRHIVQLAIDADLAHAHLEVALVPVDDKETCADSRALLYRSFYPY